MDPLKRSTATLGTAHWEINLGDNEAHRIDIDAPRDTPARVFLVDGIEHSLGGVVHRGPRLAEFSVGGHSGTLVLRVLAPSRRIRFRRSLRVSLRAALRPTILLADLLTDLLGVRFVGGLGSPTAAAAAAAAGAWSFLLWSIYELSVDGVSQGAWVATIAGYGFREWTFVESGGILPDRSMESWPGVSPKPDSRSR